MWSVCKKHNATMKTWKLCWTFGSVCGFLSVIKKEESLKQLWVVRQSTVVKYKSVRRNHVKQTVMPVRDKQSSDVPFLFLFLFFQPDLACLEPKWSRLKRWVDASEKCPLILLYHHFVHMKKTTKTARLWNSEKGKLFHSLILLWLK